MSALERLKGIIGSEPAFTGLAESILAEHAHELAEKQRERADTITGYDDAYRHAANFIDPCETPDYNKGPCHCAYHDPRGAT